MKLEVHSWLLDDTPRFDAIEIDSVETGIELVTLISTVGYRVHYGGIEGVIHIVPPHQIRLMSIRADNEAETHAVADYSKQEQTIFDGEQDE